MRSIKGKHITVQHWRKEKPSLVSVVLNNKGGRSGSIEFTSDELIELIKLAVSRKFIGIGDILTACKIIEYDLGKES